MSSFPQGILYQNGSILESASFTAGSNVSITTSLGAAVAITSTTVVPSGYTMYRLPTSYTVSQSQPSTMPPPYASAAQFWQVQYIPTQLTGGLTLDLQFAVNQTLLTTNYAGSTISLYTSNVNGAAPIVTYPFHAVQTTVSGDSVAYSPVMTYTYTGTISSVMNFYLCSFYNPGSTSTIILQGADLYNCVTTLFISGV